MNKHKMDESISEYIHSQWCFFNSNNLLKVLVVGISAHKATAGLMVGNE